LSSNFLDGGMRDPGFRARWLDRDGHRGNREGRRGREDSGVSGLLDRRQRTRERERRILNELRPGDLGLLLTDGPRRTVVVEDPLCVAELLAEIVERLPAP
jgi:hypothetical protein